MMSVSSRLAADLLRVLPRKHLSSAMGRLSDVGGPRPLVEAAIRAFVSAYGVDLDEAVVPPGGFSSFDEFFTRELKPGARVVDPRPSSVASPADGRIEDFGPMDAGAEFLVKGQTYSAAELLDDPEQAEAFRGGSFFIVYLSPRDYHRVHAPVRGRVRMVRHVDGTLLPVNSVGLSHFPLLFAKNERVVTIQASPTFGDVATIMVGAIGVGRISMSFDPRITTNQGQAASPIDYGTQGPELEKGGHLGTFHLGSTAIVMTQPGSPLRFAVSSGQTVRMGQAVAVAEQRA
jgi:phosphatidylserine decarboxylase